MTLRGPRASTSALGTNLSILAAASLDEHPGIRGTKRQATPRILIAGGGFGTDD